MTTPLSLITPDQATHLLTTAYTTLDIAVPGPAEQPPCLLLAMPPAWNNRYQSLLYTEAGPHRYAVMGIGETGSLKHVSWPGPVILHAHWFNGFFTGCQDDTAATDRFARLRDDILAFRERTGAKLIWTAHNMFPHGNLFPKTFLALRRWMFDDFDAIHVMQVGHIAALEEAFNRKAASYINVPHMTYNGSHADCVTAAAAKAHFGLTRDTFVFASFGSIQRYKNLDTLLTTFDRIAADSQRSVAAIIGGVPSEPAVVQRLQQGWGLNPRVRLVLKSVPDHEIQYFHRAADVMVLPYKESLNSGAAHMAASFDRPFIMPEGPSSQALSGLGVIAFDAKKPGGLEATMRAVMDGMRGTINPEVRAQVAPAAVSAAFFDKLDRVISRPPHKHAPAQTSQYDLVCM